MVIVDHFSKYVIFTATHVDCKVDETICLFIKHIRIYGKF